MFNVLVAIVCLVMVFVGVAVVKTGKLRNAAGAILCLLLIMLVAKVITVYNRCKDEVASFNNDVVQFSLKDEKQYVIDDTMQEDGALALSTRDNSTCCVIQFYDNVVDSVTDSLENISATLMDGDVQDYSVDVAGDKEKEVAIATYKVQTPTTTYSVISKVLVKDNCGSIFATIISDGKIDEEIQQACKTLNFSSNLKKVRGSAFVQ